MAEQPDRTVTGLEGPSPVQPVSSAVFLSEMMSAGTALSGAQGPPECSLAVCSKVLIMPRSIPVLMLHAFSSGLFPFSPTPLSVPRSHPLPCPPPISLGSCFSARMSHIALCLELPFLEACLLDQETTRWPRWLLLFQNTSVSITVGVNSNRIVGSVTSRR